MPARSLRTMENLEPRLLLASPVLAEHYPLMPTSKWEYAITEDDGGTDTLNVKVARGTRRVNGHDASRVYYDDGGDRIQTFQNFNRRGKLLVHGGTFEDGELFLQPPVALPQRLKAGLVKRTRGDIDVEFKGFEGDGDYRAVVRVGKERRISVPAGTFAAVRVRVDLRFEAEQDILFGEGPEAEGHVKHVMWLARGVGIVRAEQSYELEADFIIDEEEESGQSAQQLRSYSIAPAEDEKRARADFATDVPRKDKPAERRETSDILL